MTITASIGVATAPIHATEGKQLLKVADGALYAAKQLGRNLVRIAGEEPEAPIVEPQPDTVNGATHLKLEQPVSIPIPTIPKDEFPSGDKAVYIFLEMIALGFALGAVDALLRGDVWWRWIGAALLSAIFLVAGVKWPKVKTKLGARIATPLERIANNHRYRWGISSTVVMVLLVSIAFRAYRYYHSSQGQPPPSPRITAPSTDTSAIKTVAPGFKPSNSNAKQPAELKRTPPQRPAAPPVHQMQDQPNTPTKTEHMTTGSPNAPPKPSTAAPNNLSHQATGSVNEKTQPLSDRMTDAHVPSAKAASNESATASSLIAEPAGNLNDKRDPVESPTDNKNAQNGQPPQTVGLNGGNVPPVRPETTIGILEEIKLLLEKDRELSEMQGCPAGNSVQLRMVGGDISYYHCVKQCFAAWKTVNPKNLEFGSVNVSQPFDDPGLALVKIPCSPSLPGSPMNFCVRDEEGTFPTSNGCLKKKLKTDFAESLAMVVHAENVDSIVKLWKEFGRESEPREQLRK